MYYLSDYYSNYHIGPRGTVQEGVNSAGERMDTLWFELVDVIYHCFVHDDESLRTKVQTEVPRPALTAMGRDFRKVFTISTVSLSQRARHGRCTALWKAMQRQCAQAPALTRRASAAGVDFAAGSCGAACNPHRCPVRSSHGELLPPPVPRGSNSTCTCLAILLCFICLWCESNG